MIFPPRYPDYVDIHPVRWRRWWIALPVVLFLAGLATMLLWPEGKPTRSLTFWFWAVVCPLMVWLVALAVRWLIWLQSVANRHDHREDIAASLRAWWRQRSLLLPVEAVMLVTPSGDKMKEHLALLDAPRPLAPLQVTDAEGNASLLCPTVLGLGQESRAVLVSRHLAHKVLSHLRNTDEARPVQAFCWLGDDEGLLAFSLALESDGIRLPEDVIRLESAAELDRVTDAMPSDERGLLLCAGYSDAALSSAYTASEAAFAWLCGHQAAAMLARSEMLFPEQGETPQQLVKQLSRYACLDGNPYVTLAADKAAMEALVASGWSAVDHVLTDWLGHAGPVTPFIMQSLAALCALQGQSCGWTATFTESQLITGVCVPRGNLPH